MSKLLYTLIIIFSTCLSFIFAQQKNEAVRNSADSVDNLANLPPLPAIVSQDSLIALKYKSLLKKISRRRNPEQDIFPLRYNYLKFSDEDIFKNNSTTNFKKQFASYLKIKYKEIPDYNLGIIGKYLGISKTITAIIFALLSL